MKRLPLNTHGIIKASRMASTSGRVPTMTAIALKIEPVRQNVERRLHFTALRRAVFAAVDAGVLTARIEGKAIAFRVAAGARK